MSLPRFSVRQTVFVNLLFAILIFAGVLWAKKIPIDVYPDISFNTAIVTTIWTGASADEMERLVELYGGEAHPSWDGHIVYDFPELVVSDNGDFVGREPLLD